MTVRAKKHLGQHFLKDEDTAKNIANTLTEVSYDNILEIGPGMGMLTKYLLDKKAKITVMEIDRDSVAFCQDRNHSTIPEKPRELSTESGGLSLAYTFTILSNGEIIVQLDSSHNRDSESAENLISKKLQLVSIRFVGVG